MDVDDPHSRTPAFEQPVSSFPIDTSLPSSPRALSIRYLHQRLTALKQSMDEFAIEMRQSIDTIHHELHSLTAIRESVNGELLEIIREVSTEINFLRPHEPQQRID
jgi:hypothetical protein